MTARPAPRESIRIGDIRLTFLPDGIGTVAPGPLFPGLDDAGWVRHRRWLGAALACPAAVIGLIDDAVPGDAAQASQHPQGETLDVE